MRPPLDTLAIDPAFQKHNPALTSAEYDQLKENIIRDGQFLDSLKVWRRNDYEILLDGHNRASIWNELPEDCGIEPPAIEYLEFESKEDALDWIVLHQRGRRNLTPAAVQYQIGKLHQRAVEQPDAFPEPKETPRNHSKAVAQVAEASGKSASTVERASKFARALDTIGEVAPSFKADVVAGTQKLVLEDAMAMAKLDPGEMAKAVANVRNGRRFNDDGGSRRQRQPDGEKDLRYYQEQIGEALKKLVRCIDNAIVVDGGESEYSKTLMSLCEDVKQQLDEWQAVPF